MHIIFLIIIVLISFIVGIWVGIQNREFMIGEFAKEMRNKELYIKVLEGELAKWDSGVYRIENPNDETGN